MTYRLHPLADYWWGFVLILLIPFAGGSVPSFLFAFVLPMVVLEWFNLALVIMVISLAIEGVLFLAFLVPLRELERPFLRLVWEYMVSYWALEVVFVAGLGTATLISEPVHWLKFLLQAALLVWFAGRARNTSFHHALVVIGVALVAASPHLPISFYYLLQFLEPAWTPVWLPWREWWSQWTAPVMVNGFLVCQGLLAAWVLGRADTERPAPNKALAGLFGLDFLIHLYYPISLLHLIANSFTWGLKNGLIVLLAWRYEAVREILSRAGERGKRYWEGDFG